MSQFRISVFSSAASFFVMVGASILFLLTAVDALMLAYFLTADRIGIGCVRCRARQTFSVRSILTELQEIAESASDVEASSKLEMGCNPVPAAEVH